MVEVPVLVSFCNAEFTWVFAVFVLPWTSVGFRVSLVSTMFEINDENQFVVFIVFSLFFGGVRRHGRTTAPVAPYVSTII